MSFSHHELSRNLDATDKIIALPDDAEPLESLPLLFKENVAPDRSPQVSWISWTKNKVYEGAVVAKDGITQAIKNPVSTCLGLGTTAQPSISALVNASGAAPKDIGVKWWDSMSTGTKIQSILGLVFSLSVNFPVNKKFIGDAWEKLKTNSKDICKSLTDFLDNFVAIFLGINSGIAAAAISFEAFLWITFGGILVPTLFAALSFTISGASRYIGIKHIIAMIKNFFSFDAKEQLKTVDALKHLNLEYKVALNNALSSAQDIIQNLLDERMQKLLHEKQTLGDEDYQTLLKDLIEKASELEALHPQNMDAKLFSEKQKYEYIAEYVGTIVKLSFALVFGLTAGGIFMQKYYDAINLLSKSMFKTDLDENILNFWAKRLIGAPSGVASGILYGTSAANFPNSFFVALPAYLYLHPKEIFSTIFLLIANFYASSSLQSVTTGIVNHKNNILGVFSQGRMKQILPYLAHAGCGFVNILSELKKYRPTPSDPAHPSFAEIIKHFEDPNEHRIEHRIALACSIANNRVSFFSKTSKKMGLEGPPDLEPGYKVVMPT